MSHVFLPAGGGWVRREDSGWTVHARGYAFVRGEFLRSEDLAAATAAELARGASFPSVLAACNGLFALVALGPGRVLLAADHVRSIPLFYASTPDGLVVSDHVETFETDGPGSLPLDVESLAEFAAAGYCTGPHTVYRDVRALQAGEWAEGSAEGVRTDHWWTYRCRYDSDRSPEELSDEHDRVLMRAFERFARSLEGRQVAVSLSAGLDSRLVASCLKRLGYDRVVCYVYGREGNAEVEGSRRAAELLGYPWRQYVYAAEDWKACFASPDMARYRRWGTRGVSMPFVADWIALERMRDEGYVDRDAVFVSGVSGDFTAGSHLKYVFDPAWWPTPSDLEGAVLAKHFSLWEDLIADPRVRGAVLKRFRASVGDMPRGDDASLAACYEFWEWQERQSKYGVDFARIYSFFGHDWRLPLWDLEYCEFWKRVPLAMKVTSWLYRKSLNEHDPCGIFRNDLPGEPFDRERAEARADRPSRAERLLRALPLVEGLRRRKRRLRRHRKDYKYDPVGYPMAWTREEYVERDPDKRNSLSLILRDFLRDVYGVDIRRLPDMLART